MHKLKNKHTGEVITTPYLAEVEEYLNSGDYEMSDKKYPYIGEGKRSGNIVLFTSSSTGEVIVAGNSITDSYCEGYTSDAWSEDSFKDITSEYLLSGYGKTYGKCESQEHTDFICDLAKNAGFKLNLNFSEGDHFFFCGVDTYGFGCEKLCSNSAKLITLPLPRRESQMTEEKPVYTKEMHERGEYPKIGSEVLVRYNFDSKTATRTGKVLYVSQRHIILEKDGSDYHYKLGDYIIEPLPTIEDELTDFVFQNGGIRSRDGGKESASDVAKALLEKYNITPK